MNSGVPSFRFVGLLLCYALRLTIDGRGETITIATYNVENYGPANRMSEGIYRKDYPKPEAEKRALRSVIRGLGAEILVMQEMGDRPYLEELRRDLKAEGCDYPFAELASAACANRGRYRCQRRQERGSSFPSHRACR